MSMFTSNPHASRYYDYSAGTYLTPIYIPPLEPPKITPTQPLLYYGRNYSVSGRPDTSFLKFIWGMGAFMTGAGGVTMLTVDALEDRSHPDPTLKIVGWALVGVGTIFCCCCARVCCTDQTQEN